MSLRIGTLQGVLLVSGESFFGTIKSADTASISLEKYSLMRDIAGDVISIERETICCFVSLAKGFSYLTRETLTAESRDYAYEMFMLQKYHWATFVHLNPGLKKDELEDAYILQNFPGAARRLRNTDG